MISNTQVVHGTGSFNTSGYSLKRASRDIAPASNVAVAALDIAALENSRMHGAAPKCSRNNLECIVGPSTVLSSM
ncbi:hypothetical protein ACWYXK_27800 [Janthinobacterium lividum]|jgi:hypothetical protein|uniref:Uncharacterized protein n=1 Tax=Janthinobacterium lividum TaxID=29581 RepID=A0ABU0Y4P9_9BURK|nr:MULTISPECIES: hypothetical protein [Janthinobacterium]MBR7636901.1 hypothetical protein [Janthinobacterium lividum]MCC7700362.1 hypothetical protein [Janthinobacterium sp. EB271-G4-7A]MCC7716154.1 hypothetical protein [Janthinobacterium lividum]MDQ4629691.1 hypothetical protein [Janthinobacterium lividum]MDQ4677824.1 hypothetical protein [Janthinobacterium lividum]